MKKQSELAQVSPNNLLLRAGIDNVHAPRPSFWHLALRLCAASTARRRRTGTLDGRSMQESDVPSPIDLCDPAHARAWESTAQSRPGRSEMFQAFAAQLRRIQARNPNVLDLGSGPGFLADHLLNALPHMEVTLLDFSAVMHELARVRLRDHLAKVTLTAPQLQGHRLDA